MITKKKPNLIVTKTNKLKFKFVFEDASVAIQDAESYRDATILTIANRIRANKTKKLIGAWARDEAGGWQHVVQDQVVIQLN